MLANLFLPVLQLVGFQEEVQLREQDWGNFQVRLHVRMCQRLRSPFYNFLCGRGLYAAEAGDDRQCADGSFTWTACAVCLLMYHS